MTNERLVMGIHLNKNKCGDQNILRQGTKGGVFGLGNELKCFYKTPKFRLEKHSLVMGSMYHIKHHTIIINVIVLTMF